ncbi:MAG: Hvo_1808 family surface protein [Halobacteriaceae archaeon]
MRRRLAVAAVAALLLVAGCAAYFEDPEDGGRPDPATDVAGWEDGVWHNESLDVDQSDGLGEAELDAVVARATARVEYIRGHEFEQTVDVTVRSREEFRADSGRDPPAEARLRRNALYEGLFFVGEGTDAVSVLAANRGGGTLGYYSPGEDRIVLVADGGVAVDERTLGHELVHALQDQEFETAFGGPTVEARNAAASVVEGDAAYVDYRYGQRCGEEWTCLTVESRGSGYAHVGVALLQVFPYSDGAAFVADRHRDGGWAAVDALYRDPPASTEQVIHPGKYGRDPPTDVGVEDRSGPAWSVVGRESVGEPGLFTMLWYPSYRNGSDVVVPRNVSSGPGPDVYDYAHPYSAGWDGDRLVAYARDSSARTNETGYVWKTAWDSPADAEEFAAAYRELLEYHGARQVGESTYRIPEGDGDAGGFADAFHVAVAGDTVTVVNAPTVAALTAVRDDLAVERTTATARTARAATTATTATTGTETTRAPGTPGFGAAGAAVAVALALVAARRR